MTNKWLLFDASEVIHIGYSPNININLRIMHIVVALAFPSFCSVVGFKNYFAPSVEDHELIAIITHIDSSRQKLFVDVIAIW